MKCIKCGYNCEKNKMKFGKNLCFICHVFSPNEKRDFEKYIEEKIDEKILDAFRKYPSVGEKQKKGMVLKAIEGKTMSRAPFGYKIEKGVLIPAENSKEIEEIFEEFLKEKISLRRLAEKHNLSVNGLKKILKNFTYIGKLKFNNQIYEGKHDPLISTTLFNHVQNKLERKGIK